MLRPDIAAVLRILCRIIRENNVTELIMNRS